MPIRKDKVLLMQTFFPYPNVIHSINCLDYKRLGKQRVEAMQILNIITGKSQSKAWRNHPAVLMWYGYDNLLKYYMNYAIIRWVQLGYKNTMKLQKHGLLQFPDWYGNSLFHDSHKSNLLRKDQSYYKQFDWQIKSDLPYYWPVQSNK